MKTKENISEIATISAIISDTIFKKLYTISGIGYMATADQIAEWAVEFNEKYKDVDWVDLTNNGEPLKAVSKCLKNLSILSFDDAIIDFSHHKLENY
jgi:hypothetical protein